MKSMIRYLKPTKHQRRLSLLEPPSSYPPYFYFKVVLTVGLTIMFYAGSTTVYTVLHNQVVLLQTLNWAVMKLHLMYGQFALFKHG